MPHAAGSRQSPVAIERCCFPDAAQTRQSSRAFGSRSAAGGMGNSKLGMSIPEATHDVTMPTEARSPRRLLRTLQRHDSQHNTGDSCRQVWPSQFTGEQPTTVRFSGPADGFIVHASIRPLYIDDRMPLPGYVWSIRKSVVSQNAIPGGLAPAVQPPRANSVIPVGPVSRTPR